MDWHSYLWYHFEKLSHIWTSIVCAELPCTDRGIFPRHGKYGNLERTGRGGDNTRLLQHEPQKHTGSGLEICQDDEERLAIVQCQGRMDLWCILCYPWNILQDAAVGCPRWRSRGEGSKLELPVPTQTSRLRTLNSFSHSGWWYSMAVTREGTRQLSRVFEDIPKALFLF
eukprot:g41799.t1